MTMGVTGLGALWVGTWDSGIRLFLFVHARETKQGSRDAALIRQGDAAHERRINKRRASGAACALAKTRKTRASGRRCRRQVESRMSLCWLSDQSVSQYSRVRAPSKQSKLRGGACKRAVDVDMPRLFVPSTTQAVRVNSALACDNLFHGSIGGGRFFSFVPPPVVIL